MRRAVTALRALLLGGAPLLVQACAHRPPPPVPKPLPAAQRPAPTPVPRPIPQKSRVKAAPAPMLTVLVSANVEDQVSKRTQLLARRDELRLQRSDAGYYLDVEEAQLRRKLKGTVAVLVRQKDLILLRVPGKFAFDADSIRLRAEARALLGTVAPILVEFGRSLVVVSGRGPDQRLSERRAVAVATQLMEQGVDAARLAAVAHAEASPPADDDTGGTIEIQLQLIVDDAS